MEAPARPERELATVLFTDMVGATRIIERIGDDAWRRLLQRHHTVVRGLLSEHSGREIDTAGDGFLAAFESPACAVRCALAIRDAMRPLGLEIRCGLHTGECEVNDGKLTGIAVHIGARVMGHAKPGEVLASRTVRDVVAGSGLEFCDRGFHELKGVSEPWRLYAADSEEPAPDQPDR